MLRTPFRTLYSASSLGLDGFLRTRARSKLALSGSRAAFLDRVSASDTVYTEDLKMLVHSADPPDLETLLVAVRKFRGQNSDLRFGSYVFGPVLMRLFHVLRLPQTALDSFLRDTDLYDQTSSFLVLLDALFVSEMYPQILLTYDTIRTRQIRGTRHPRNCVNLVLAACYMIDTRESLEYAQTLWKELSLVGHIPSSRATCYFAALALSRGRPEFALEIIESATPQNRGYYMTKNVEASALSDLSRPQESLRLLQSSRTILEEVLEKTKASLLRSGDEEFLRESGKIRDSSRISCSTLRECLCSEIVLRSDNGVRNSRPGLYDSL